MLERMVFPEPVISQAVEPKTKADQEKMGIALNRLAQEDPSFRVRTDEESGQTIISGMGELHLEIIVDRMKREFGVEANVGKPQVAYRETIKKPVEIEGKFVKQSGGRGQYGHVWLKIEPQSRARASSSSTRSRAARVPREYIPAVKKGVDETLHERRARRLSRWSTSRSRCSTARTTTSTRTRTRSRWRRRSRSRTACAQAQPGAARADDGGRGRDARGLHGQRDGRPVVAPRHDPGHGRPARRQGDQGRSAAGRDVRLLDDAALADAGPRDVHDGIQALHRGAEERRRGDHQRKTPTRTRSNRNASWQKANSSGPSRT